MNAISTLEASQKKTKLAEVHVGDTVRVHQRITEGKKSRVQVFEGLVIRYSKPGSLQAIVTVRKIASGIGVEKSWLVHSPNVEKIQIVKRSKVRQAFLGYMRDRSGKSARLAEMGFDKDAVNASDNRTTAQIESEEEAKIAKEEVALDGDAAAKDDVLNQPDTESTDGQIKKEEKAAAEGDATPASDNEPKNAPADEKINSDGNDEQQEAPEEFKEGVERNVK